MAREKKRPPGRPKSENPLKKRWFRITDRDWELIEQVAGGERSQWIRTTLIRAARRKAS
jgi:hypothetical protein